MLIVTKKKESVTKSPPVICVDRVACMIFYNVYEHYEESSWIRTAIFSNLVEYTDRDVEALFSTALQRDNLLRVSMVENTVALPLEMSLSHAVDVTATQTAKLSILRDLFW